MYLDAKALPQYGYERHNSLLRVEKANEKEKELRLLVERKADLTQMHMQEKNRYQAPLNASLRSGIKTVIACLEKQIKNIDSKINKIIDEDDSLTRKKKSSFYCTRYR
jgi:hypothetical protein